MHRILFVVSEALPLVKTGGLADVAGSLPPALAKAGAEVRVLLPAYRDALDDAGPLTSVAQFTLPGSPDPVRLLEARRNGTVYWLLDHPAAYDRPGNPYHDDWGRAWPDNAWRFALLCQAGVAIALGQAGLGWQPDVVHAHDWQAGLVPALLSRVWPRPATVFTLHNLAYAGQFPREALQHLGLPGEWWSPEALEFHGQLAFIKGGLVYADRLTTVSPTYAREIQTPAGGFGLDGLLHARSGHLTGILNGIDETVWNPRRDVWIDQRYSARSLARKARNRTALAVEHGLHCSEASLLIGMVCRLTWQKGVDLVLRALPELMRRDIALVVLGTGDDHYEHALTAAARRYRGYVSAQIGYDERAAHRITAGADAFLMPSRFEPCGLNQMYSLRYGTVPIVRRVGGLADTVVHADPAALTARRATGLSLEQDDTHALVWAVDEALRLKSDSRVWRTLQTTGMAQDFSWSRSAREYLALYASIVRGAAGSDTLRATG